MPSGPTVSTSFFDSVLLLWRKIIMLKRMIKKGKMRLKRSQTSIFLITEVAGKLLDTEMKRAERTIKLVMLTVMMASK